MFSLDARAARATWTVLLIAILAAAVYLVRGTLLVFTAALLLAYLLSPLVDLVDRLARSRIPRNFSLAVVYIFLVAVLGAVAAAVGSRIAEEASALAGRLPELLKRLEEPLTLPVPEWLGPFKAQVVQTVQAELAAHSQDILPFLQKAGMQALSALGSLTFLILVPILSFFFLKDGREIRQKLVDQFAGGPRRALLEDILGDVHVLLAQFMRALVILCAATFVFYGLFFWAAGVPYALLLAGVAGLLEFIPVLGPFSAAVIILVVAGFSGYGHLLWILAFLGGYRLFQDYVLQPYLMSNGVELHPLLVIFGVLAGEQIAGVPGMFLSIPVLATLRVIYVRVQKARGAGGRADE